MNENVRVVASADPVVDGRIERAQRTPAQRHADEALEQAEDLARKALDAAVESLEWLAVVKAPVNRDVPRYLTKLVEEISEAKRMRK